MPKFEIEQKFRVKNPSVIRKIILGLKAKKVSSGFEQNQVFDLKRLGVQGILRLRKTGKKGKLTFKGPRLDGVYKKRVEVESDVDYENMNTIFKLLKWKPFFCYAKNREEYKLGKIIITLDYLKGKGWFSEIEASEKDIKKTALKLGFKDSDREERTYLEILGYKRASTRADLNSVSAKSVQAGLKDAKVGRLVKPREDYSKYIKKEKPL